MKKIRLGLLTVMAITAVITGCGKVTDNIDNVGNGNIGNSNIDQKNMEEEEGSLEASKGTESNSNIGDTGNSNINQMDMNEVERLPEEQKETELDKILAERRKYAKENTKAEAGGGSTSISMTDGDIPGQSKNRPDFIYEFTDKFFVFISDYLKTELNIPEPSLGYYIAQCMDPRMNAIYDDSDKGVASGYDNDNIIVMEYETAKENVYSYLIVVRDNKDSQWKIIYDGSNYKE